MRLTNRFGRWGTVMAVVAATSLAGASLVAADVVYNTLDNTIDATHESMNNVPVGGTGSTTLKIQVDGRPDHPGCNIQGASHYIGLTAVVADPTIASVSFLNDDDTFNACNETLTVTVTGLAAGSTTISFVIDATKSSNDPHLGFSLAEATFVVNVTGVVTDPPPTACDADPAAPAWAAALLQKNGVKLKKGKPQPADNYVAQVAALMGNGATFEGFAKNAHPDYENAVWDYLKSLGLVLPLGPSQVARPGWVCTPTS